MAICLNEIFPDIPNDLDLSMLDTNRIPDHVAVIMDGNGRWAKKRALNRLKGHKAGINAVRETIRCASDLGVKVLTIYSFSTENWSRPAEEVLGLMDLFAKTIIAEVDELHTENVRVVTMGDLTRLPEKTSNAFKEAIAKTAKNTGMTLQVALNYGSRQQILHTFKQCAVSEIVGNKDRWISFLESENPDIESAPDFGISEDDFSKAISIKGIPDPDLLIRTSGELRISNFMLWQIAYTEIFVTDTLWPDFDRYEFLRALLSFQSRDRRFGASK